MAFYSNNMQRLHFQINKQVHNYILSLCIQARLPPSYLLGLHAVQLMGEWWLTAMLHIWLLKNSLNGNHANQDI